MTTTNLTTDQQALLARVNARHNTGYLYSKQKGDAQAAKALIEAGLVFRVGKTDQLTISRDGIALLTAGSPANKIRENAEELAELLPTAISLIEAAATQMGESPALRDLVKRLRAATR